MTKYFHGIRQPFAVLSSGAILSPWHQQVEELSRAGRLPPKVEREIKTKGLENYALELASMRYGSHDEHRVMSVSLTQDLKDAAHYAKGDIGIVVATHLPNDIKDNIYFCPEPISLNKITEVHYKSVTSEDITNIMTKMFQEHNSKVLTFVDI
jgi:hypothetical protein